MFYGRQTEHRVEKPVYETDELGYETVSYKPFGKCLIYIVEQDRSTYKANDFDLVTSTVVGYTDDKRIQANYRVDGKYVVTNAFPHKLGSVLYMEGIEDGK